MVDIKSVIDELVVPNIFVMFNAPETVVNKNGTIIKKNHRYTMHANTGKVYARNHEPILGPETKWLSYSNWSQRAYRIDAADRYSEPHPALVAWQEVPKYDVVALVQWIVACDYSNEQSLEITKGVPNCGIVATKSDPESLFRWAVPENNVFAANVMVIDREKNVICEQSLEWRHSWIHCFSNIIRSASDIRYTEDYSILGTFFGRSFLGRNMYGIPNTPENISMFMRAKAPKGKNGPKQQKVDQLTAISLKPYTPPISMENTDHYCCITRVNDEWAVVRWFQREISRIGGHVETYRLYVSKNDSLYCRTDENGNFVYFGGKLSATTFTSQYTFLESDDVFKDTKLEYFTEIYKSLGSADARAKALFMLVSYPEFEKFWKAGFTQMCESYLTNSWGKSWKDHINPILGAINPKERNLHAVLGVNKHQLEKCTANEDVRIADLKRAFSMDDLRDLDNQSFDSVFDFIAKNRQNSSRGRNGYYYYSQSYNAIHALTLTVETWSMRTMLNVLPCLTSIINQSVVVTPRYRYTYRNESDAMSVYCDFVQMVVSVDGASRIKPYFKTKEELADMHNILVDVLNADEANARRLQEAALAEQFKARTEVWKKWEYDKNDQWIVVAPTAPLDLAQEGIELRHCVRSYIPKVAAGQTNIVFIREKEKPDVPFFTVEVLNNNTVRQIHGACNRNVCTEPGLDEFVKEWAKAVKVKASSYNSVLA